MDLLLERQRILEEKVTRIEQEFYGGLSIITEQDFVEVYNISIIIKYFRNTPKYLKNLL